MKWLIPAKTFLLGEYAAIAEASAIIVTTTPCFELSLTNQEGLSGIHPDSPAGLWWQKENNHNQGLSWCDPYKGLGGLGASSAQFLASYLASYALKDKATDLNQMLAAYYEFSWSGAGLRPSGYDVIAQSQQSCVYINKQKKIIQSSPWPFTDLSFVLIHTGVKLATHHHLQQTTLPPDIETLSVIVDEAQNAFQLQNSSQFIKSINNYHYNLCNLNLVASHSLDLIHRIKEYPETLAIKGCGALGSDTILIITHRHQAPALQEKLLALRLLILATETNVTPINNSPLLEGSL